MASTLLAQGAWEDDGGQHPPLPVVRVTVAIGDGALRPVSALIDTGARFSRILPDLLPTGDQSSDTVDNVRIAVGNLTHTGSVAVSTDAPAGVQLVLGMDVLRHARLSLSVTAGFVLLWDPA